ncbi:MAG: hypothetical protein WCC10_00065 [Tumebacillaceae bacterium]
MPYTASQCSFPRHTKQKRRPSPAVRNYLSPSTLFVLARLNGLASRFIGADLTQPEFWRNALDLIVEDVNEFLRLTE